MVRYPHMMPKDTMVWTKFLQSQQFGLKEVWYDVHVGPRMETTNESDKILVAVSDGLTRKRIDVVASVGGGFWIIEVKPRADAMAVGQVLNYAHLFRKQFGTMMTVVPVIVADEVDPVIIDQIDDLGVGVLVNSG